MLLFKSKYIKDLHNFVNCKMCYIFTLTFPKKNPVCPTDIYEIGIPYYMFLLSMLYLYFNAQKAIVQSFTSTKFTNVKVYNLLIITTVIFLIYTYYQRKKSKFFTSLQFINILLIGP
jgi:hypothetical protein